MPAVEARASTILVKFSQAQAEIVGKAVILSDGKAGTVDYIWLDQLHGLGRFIMPFVAHDAFRPGSALWRDAFLSVYGAV
jgi:hypothetical protein